jgi:hypothetical protein
MYVVVRRLLRLLAGGSAVAGLEVENAVLWHQLAVLRRGVKRPAAAAERSCAARGGERAAGAGTMASVSGIAADAASLAP